MHGDRYLYEILYLNKELYQWIFENPRAGADLDLHRLGSTSLKLETKHCKEHF